MSYDDFTAKLVTENLALKKQLDSAVEALKIIRDDALYYFGDSSVIHNQAKAAVEAALASIKE